MKYCQILFVPALFPPDASTPLSKTGGGRSIQVFFIRHGN